MYADDYFKLLDDLGVEYRTYPSELSGRVYIESAIGLPCVDSTALGYVDSKGIFVHAIITDLWHQLPYYDECGEPLQNLLSYFFTEGDILDSVRKREEHL